MRKQDDAPADSGDAQDESIEGQATRLLAEGAESQKGKADEPDEEPDEAPEDSEDEGDDETADDADEPEEEEDGDEAERYALDERVLEGIPEEKAAAIRKRWREQARGIEKRFERESAVMRTYLSAFEDPEHAGPALRQLAGDVAKFHGKTADALLGTAPKDADDDAEVDEDDWQTLVDRKIARRIAEVEERYRPLVEEREARARKESEESRLSQVLPLVQSYARTHWGGFKPSREQVAEAMENLPKLSGKPIKAVERWYAKEILTAQQRREAKRAPDMARPAGRTEPEAVDLSEMSLEEQARHVLRREIQR